MQHCDCGCINPDHVKKLASKPLRELEESDYVSYHGSALYTWGELEHYKHFLPRILEVHNILKGRGLIGLYEVTTKLEYAHWDTWDKRERDAITNFILLDWIEFVNNSESDMDADDLKYYSYFFGLRQLVELWNFRQSTFGLRNFINFFYDHGTEILNVRWTVQDKSSEGVWKDLIHAEDLLGLLEIEFFKVHESDSPYAEKISVVMQMIEQEKKVNYNL